jgi:hypothetical protein
LSFQLQHSNTPTLQHPANASSIHLDRERGKHISATDPHPHHHHHNHHHHNHNTSSNNYFITNTTNNNNNSLDVVVGVGQKQQNG